VKIDKELYRKAYAALREWSEAERIERIRDARRLTPQERWQQFVDLVDFGLRIAPPESERLRDQKMAALDRYYERVRRMEAGRHARGKAS
jgi:hypothetical protein